MYKIQDVLNVSKGIMWQIVIQYIDVYNVRCRIVDNVWIIMGYVIIVYKDILLYIPIIIAKNGLYKIVVFMYKNLCQ